MAFPNSPLDPLPRLFGWPWHGLMRQENDSDKPKLTFPSGRVVDCGVAGNWTFLWDIGMPAPVLPVGVELEPDEQWWSKAVLRAFDGASFQPVGWGGMPAPIYLDGMVGRLEVGVLANDIFRRVEISARVTLHTSAGVSTSEVNTSISWSAIGIPSDFNTGFQCQLIDRSADGRKALVRLYRSTPVPPRLRDDQLGILELEAGGTFSAMALAVRVIANTPAARGTWTVLEEPEPGERISLTSNVGAGINEADAGDFRTRYRLDQTCWAWYGEDGQTVVPVSYAMTYDAHVVSVVNKGAAFFDWRADKTTTATFMLSAGGRTTTATSVVSGFSSGNYTEQGSPPEALAVSDMNYQLLWDGETVDALVDHHEQTFAVIDGRGPWEVVPDLTLAPILVRIAYLHNDQSSQVWEYPSNKVLELGLRLWNDATQADRIDYSPGLTPVSVSGERVTLNTGDAHKSGVWRASFCPVTYQVARHLDIYDYSWI